MHPWSRTSEKATRPKNTGSPRLRCDSQGQVQTGRQGHLKDRQLDLRPYANSHRDLGQLSAGWAVEFRRTHAHDGHRNPLDPQALSDDLRIATKSARPIAVRDHSYQLCVRAVVVAPQKAARDRFQTKHLVIGARDPRAANTLDVFR